MKEQHRKAHNREKSFYTVCGVRGEEIVPFLRNIISMGHLVSERQKEVHDGYGYEEVYSSGDSGVVITCTKSGYIISAYPISKKTVQKYIRRNLK